MISAPGTRSYTRRAIAAGVWEARLVPSTRAEKRIPAARMFPGLPPAPPPGKKRPTGGDNEPEL